jgi:HEAT repeats
VTDTFSQAMRLMRKHDPQLREDGFAMLGPIATDVLPQLIAAFEEESDHGLRCWLLELIGDSRSESALPVLIRELTSDDESIRGWARRGLEQLDTKEARTILWRDSRNEAR